MINPPRPGKKLLVLDLDHTLLDFSESSGTNREVLPSQDILFVPGLISCTESNRDDSPDDELVSGTSLQLLRPRRMVANFMVLFFSDSSSKKY